MGFPSSNYPSTAVGYVKNTGDETIEKAVLTIHFFGKKFEAVYTWFDIYSWKSGQEIAFAFLNIRSPMKAFRCELRVKEVKLASLDSQSAQEKLSVFVPQGGDYTSPSRFPNYEFYLGDEVIAKNYVEKKKVSTSTFAKMMLNALPHMILNYICILIAIILCNICEVDKKWNHEIKMDLLGAFLIVLGIMGLNFLTALTGGFILLMLVCFILKLFLFYLFLKRDFGYTLLIILFYFLIVLTLQGLIGNIM